MAELTAPVYSADGGAKGTATLDEAIFGIEPNVPVMHQVVTAQLAAARSGSASTKTRSEVRGGGAKPWRQKGLGRARHGSIRSPQWAGGGVVHGPKPRSYRQRTPKKMKRLALRSALSARAADGRVAVVDGFDWAEPKTKLAAALLRAMETGGDKVLVVVTQDEGVAHKSFRNMSTVRLNEIGQLNTYDVLWADWTVFSADALEMLGSPKSTESAAGDDVTAASLDSAPNAESDNGATADQTTGGGDDTTDGGDE